MLEEFLIEVVISRQSSDLREMIYEHQLVYYKVSLLENIRVERLIDVLMDERRLH